MTLELLSTMQTLKMKKIKLSKIDLSKIIGFWERPST